MANKVVYMSILVCETVDVPEGTPKADIFIAAQEKFLRHDPDYEGAPISLSSVWDEDSGQEI